MSAALHAMQREKPSLPCTSNAVLTMPLQSMHEASAGALLCRNRSSASILRPMPVRPLPLSVSSSARA